jgi:hypothetical protein
VQLTWRTGSRGPLTSWFVILRVRPAGHHQAARRVADGSLPAVWLLAEWPPQATEPTDYWLSSLPETTPPAELVRLAKIRWRIEHDYRELKTALDHFEGRTYSGWHPAADQPTSACLGLSLYAVLRELQALLATCTVCDQHLYARPRASTNEAPPGDAHWSGLVASLHAAHRGDPRTVASGTGPSVPHRHCSRPGRAEPWSAVGPRRP